MRPRPSCPVGAVDLAARVRQVTGFAPSPRRFPGPAMPHLIKRHGGWPKKNVIGSLKGKTEASSAALTCTFAPGLVVSIGRRGVPAGKARAPSKAWVTVSPGGLSQAKSGTTEKTQFPYAGGPAPCPMSVLDIDSKDHTIPLTNHAHCHFVQLRWLRASFGLIVDLGRFPSQQPLPNS